MKKTQIFAVITDKQGSETNYVQEKPQSEKMQTSSSSNSALSMKLLYKHCLSKVRFAKPEGPSLLFSRNPKTKPLLCFSLHIHFLTLKWRQLLENQAGLSSERSRQSADFEVPGHRPRLILPPPSPLQLQPSPHAPPPSSTAPGLPHVSIFVVLPLLPVSVQTPRTVPFRSPEPARARRPNGRATTRSGPACARHRRILARSGAASTRTSALARRRNSMRRIGSTCGGRR